MGFITKDFACMKCVIREERIINKGEEDSQRCEKCGVVMDRLVSSTQLGNTGTSFNNKSAIPDD